MARVNVTYYKQQPTTDWPGGDIRVVSYASLFCRQLMAQDALCDQPMHLLWILQVSVRAWPRDTTLPPPPPEPPGYLPPGYTNAHAYGITQCYLPPGRADIPALTTAEAGTRFSDPGGMQG